MKKILVGVIVVALLALVASRFMGGSAAVEPAPVRDDATLRSIASGQLVGYKDTEHAASGWRGIPFAAPASGANRWHAPAPPSAWSGTLEALEPGPMCPQFGSLLSGGDETGSNTVVGQEDCLYLNIWAPLTATAAAPKPVMLWIHGGGNTIGHGGSYDGARLAAQEDVVVMTFNYRLGIFGWFSHDALASGNPADDSGNYGTLDIVRALEWTRDNVNAFGGDPDNVTLFGESAGGFDTLAMIASPLAKGLFHRAIVQSGGFYTTPLQEARAFASAGGHAMSSAEIVNKLLVGAGRAPDAATARAMQEDLPAAEISALLRAATVDDLFALLDGGGFGMIDLPDNFGDGYVLPAATNAEIFGDASRHNVVPTMLGTNRDEPALFMVRDPRYVDNFLWIFPRLKDESEYLRAVRYGALAWKERGVDSIAELLTSAGNPDVYAYRFDWDEEPSIMGYDLSTALGAAHGLEIAFVFGHFDGGLGLGYLYKDSEHKEDLARSMMGYWAQFARQGDPGKGSQGRDPLWSAWGVGGDRLLVLDTAPAGIRMVDELVTEESLLAALDSDPEIQNQKERCELYATSFRFNGFDPEVYSSLGNSGCDEWDVESFRRF